MRFIGIEELQDNYLDINFIPEKLRFSNATEALQCMLLPIAGRLGIDLPTIYRNFSKVRLFLNQAKKELIQRINLSRNHLKNALNSSASNTSFSMSALTILSKVFLFSIIIFFA